MNDEEMIWEAYDKALNNDVVSTITLNEAISKGYDLFHRERNKRNIRNASYVLLFAKDLDEIHHYGEYLYSIKSKDFSEIPEWVIEWTSNHYRFHDYVDYLNPERIVNSAGSWDSPEFVSVFWDENEHRLIEERIFGFLTKDGAVVFDPINVDIVEIDKEEER